MPNIFLAPRSNETSYKNFESTILGGRKYSEIESYLTPEEKGVLSKYPVISVWGNKESLRNRWSAMEPGDYVLFYAKGFFYFSARVVLTKFDDELGRKLWPTDKKRDNKPWPCLFFVDNLKEIKIPIQTVQELAEYSDNWDRVQGFQPLNESGTNAIIDKFGSLEDFINQTPEAMSLIQKIIEKNQDEIVQDEVDDSTDLDDVFKQAADYTASGPGYKENTSTKKVRVENKKQKQRIAKIEDNSCQICGWKLEWTNKKGKKCFRIDIDHIIEKSDGGGEEMSNLWALCPNCHTEKTLKVITIDMENKKVLKSGREISLHHDKHLFV